jgi:hypothetical protein
MSPGPNIIRVTTYNMSIQKDNARTQFLMSVSIGIGFPFLSKRLYFSLSDRSIKNARLSRGTGQYDGIPPEMYSMQSTFRCRVKLNGPPWTVDLILSSIQ